MNKSAAQLQATEALAALAASAEVRTILAQLQSAQAACDADGSSWETREGVKVEAAAGLLMMALEKAGVQF